MNPILIQTIYYAVVMFLSIFAISMIQPGFFWAYMRVKLSFGRLIVVKVRAINRDFFKVGKIEEGFLIFKSNEGYKRIDIKNKSVFYRVMGTTWMDLEDSTSNLCSVDYSVVQGFDSVKYNNLYLRALYKPKEALSMDRLILGGIILVLIGIGFLVYLMIMNGDSLASIHGIVNGIRSNTATIVAGGI